VAVESWHTTGPRRYSKRRWTQSHARYTRTRALRQVLAAARRWGLHPPQPRRRHRREPGAPRAEEIRPFTPEELAAIVVELSDSACDAGVVIFAAETGLRTSEWPALERRDIDWANPAVAVQRRYADGKLTLYPKTAKSRRRVPLTPRAVDALEQLPRRIDAPLLFPNRWGGRLNFNMPHLDPGAQARRRRPSRSLPPAAHVRHRGARRRRVDLRALPSHGRLGRDDRQDLRPSRPGQRAGAQAATLSPVGA
jgi:integrase